MNEYRKLRWIDSDTVLLVDRIDDSAAELAAEEVSLASQMQPKRRREFIAGRCLARRALAALNEANATIPRGPAGEPLWPPGIVGSLSHTATHAAALVSRRVRHISVGVDLDDHRLLGDSAAAVLMTDDEIGLVLARQWASNRALAQNLVFCAKEAVFKCQYPLTGERDLDFHEVQLTASIVPNALAVACSARNSGLAAGLTGILLFMFSIQGLRIIVAIAPAARAEMIV